MKKNIKMHTKIFFFIILASLVSWMVFTSILNKSEKNIEISLVEDSTINTVLGTHLKIHSDDDAMINMFNITNLEKGTSYELRYRLECINLASGKIKVFDEAFRQIINGNELANNNFTIALARNIIEDELSTTYCVKGENLTQFISGRVNIEDLDLTAEDLVKLFNKNNLRIIGEVNNSNDEIDIILDEYRNNDYALKTSLSIQKHEENPID